jgi:hypothetical protein
MGFRWVKAPSHELAPNIKRYGDRGRVAVRAVAAYMAQKMQGEMHDNAPWEDRTGNARSGLFCAVEEASGDLVRIYLSHGHTIEYGQWLELAHGKRYAVIMPTMEANLPVIEDMLQRIFK